MKTLEIVTSTENGTIVRQQGRKAVCFCNGRSFRCKPFTKIELGVYRLLGKINEIQTDELF